MNWGSSLRVGRSHGVGKPSRIYPSNLLISKTGRYAQITNDPSTDGTLNAVLLV